MSNKTKPSKRESPLFIAVVLLALVSLFVIYMTLMIADISYDKNHYARQLLVTTQHQSEGGLIEYNQCVIDHTNELTEEEFVEIAVKNIEKYTGMTQKPASVAISYPCGTRKQEGLVQTKIEHGSRAKAILTNLPQIVLPS